MHILYHDLAERAGVIVVPACGFDSVIADMGVVHHVNQYGGKAASAIDSYFALKSVGGGNAATFDSLIDGVSNLAMLTYIRKQVRGAQ